MKKIKFLTSFLACSFLNNIAYAQLSCTGFTSATFNFTGAPQTWTVPAGVTSIIIKAKGASGGLCPSTGFSAGGGAIIEGEYTVTPGSTVTILVAGMGANGDNFESGGGGSTGIYIDGTLYIVAGGGGGEDNTGNGGVGVAGIDGTDGLPVFTSTNCAVSHHINDSRGGVSGAGGFHGDICNAVALGAGGGGLNSGGTNGTDATSAKGGGQGSINGAAGGAAGTSGGTGAAGGWGWSGGGGAFERASGGGGGYSGGAGAGNSGRPGGGGSFLLAGSANSFTSDGTLTTTAQNGTVTICYANVLPLKLLGFSAALDNSCVSLRWTTAQENNVNKFLIERSPDGVNFNGIGEMPATNTPAQKQYRFNDCTVGNSKWFYRIKILDNDGQFIYSKIISIHAYIKGNALTEIYPSPFTDKINIVVVNEIARRADIEILDNAGKLINAYARPVNKGVNNITIENLDKLAKGFYIIKVSLDQNVFTQKLVK
jgi:hypothetical protein